MVGGDGANWGSIRRKKETSKDCRGRTGIRTVEKNLEYYVCDINKVHKMCNRK